MDFIFNYNIMDTKMCIKKIHVLNVKAFVKSATVA